jgi:hypothetical protein
MNNLGVSAVKQQERREFIKHRSTRCPAFTPGRQGDPRAEGGHVGHAHGRAASSVAQEHFDGECLRRPPPKPPGMWRQCAHIVSAQQTGYARRRTPSRRRARRRKMTTAQKPGMPVPRHCRRRAQPQKAGGQYALRPASPQSPDLHLDRRISCAHAPC